MNKFILSKITLLCVIILSLYLPFYSKQANSLTNYSTSNVVSQVNKYGYITKINTNDENTYFEIDLIEFYLGESAKAEFLKDFNEVSDCCFGSDYYIRNEDANSTLFKVSPSTNFQLCNYVIYPNETFNNSTEVLTTSKEYFIDFAKSALNNTIFKFHCENGVITSISQQYTP